ncbi:MAG: hypothetical protein JO202_08560 [Ktedonobacteraceae bacterium]|nr:hypothetical protein [Ktedonobacteraceae bacterium]
MAKLQDMFTQARRAQGGGSIGFLGKSKAEAKPSAAALTVRFTQVIPGASEAALKAGAHGLLFTWNGWNSTLLETIKKEIDSAKTFNEALVSGLSITNGWDNVDREGLIQLKEQGLQYVVLPLDAPARLIALESKDIELVVTVPMRPGDMYPLVIRNLTAFDAISGVILDFGLTHDTGSMTIEDILQYRAVREAVRFPALLNVQADLTEADAYALLALGVQAFVLTVSDMDYATRQQIKALRELLEKVHQEEKEVSVRK